MGGACSSRADSAPRDGSHPDTRQQMDATEPPRSDSPLLSRQAELGKENSKAPSSRQLPEGSAASMQRQHRIRNSSTGSAAPMPRFTSVVSRRSWSSNDSIDVEQHRVKTTPSLTGSNASFDNCNNSDGSGREDSSIMASTPLSNDSRATRDGVRPTPVLPPMPRGWDTPTMRARNSASSRGGGLPPLPSASDLFSDDSDHRVPSPHIMVANRSRYPETETSTNSLNSTIPEMAATAMAPRSESSGAPATDEHSAVDEDNNTVVYQPDNGDMTMMMELDIDSRSGSPQIIVESATMHRSSSNSNLAVPPYVASGHINSNKDSHAASTESALGSVSVASSCYGSPLLEMSANDMFNTGVLT